MFGRKLRNRILDDQRPRCRDEEDVQPGGGLKGMTYALLFGFAFSGFLLLLCEGVVRVLSQASGR